MKLAIALAAAVTAAACSAPAPPAAPAAPRAVLPAGTLVDLSHTYDQSTIFWPTADPFRLDVVADGITPGGYYYAANNFFSSEHGGTHLDAPVHFSEGAQSVDQIPLDRLVGEAYVVDVTAAAEKDADYQVTVEDLARAERDQGPIPADAILLLRTGFSRRWPDAVGYLGTAARGEEGARQLHFPGLHPDAARWIADNRPIRALGIDTASIDYGPSTAFETHRALYAKNIPGLENLTALDRLPLRGAVVIALPMKIGGGSGAPVRAMAIVP
ncbi:MAG: cyclase family protein [Vicinamibacterales bacterium]